MTIASLTKPAPDRQRAVSRKKNLLGVCCLPAFSGTVFFRASISLLLLAASATGAAFVLPQSQPGAQSRPALSGGIENNDGRLRLYLSNESEREFRGRAVIGIGADSEPREVGQAAIEIPPLDSRLWQIKSISPTGSHYSLRVFDRNGAVVFYKIAPLKSVSDSTPAVEIALTATSASPAQTNEPSATAAAATNNPAESQASNAEITIKARLLAGEAINDPFKISFEMTAPRPINQATLAITMGKHKDQKPINITRTLTAEFKLPDDLDTERISYTLTAKDGRVIVQGEIQLEQLMAEDSINVSDIRTDRPSYDFGETAKVTVVLEGKSPHGYRIEVKGRDASGAVFFTDQRESKASEHAAAQEFTIILPRDGQAPLIFEFKIHDGETGLLFDSGEREIPLNGKEQRL
jgi:hypothetical protein